jgi:hypothetical protein
LIALVILLWGVVDIVSASASLITAKAQPSGIEMMSPEGGNINAGDIKGIEPSIEDYYQKRMVLDRVGDSLARIVVSGLVFWAFSSKIRSQES